MQFLPVIRPQTRRYAALLSSALLFSAAIFSIQRGLAQSPPTCDPPGANEYLLLVTNQQAGTEEQLRQLLPANAAITSCQYLDDQVVRVGGFADAEIANAWAKYVTDTTGLQAFVASPTAETATATPSTPTEADSAAANEGVTTNGATNFPTPTQIPSAAATSSPTPSAPAQNSTAENNTAESNTAESNTAENSTAELPSLNQSPTPSVVPAPSPTVPSPAPSAAPSTPTPSPAVTAPSAPSASSPNPAFDPKPLGSGYAVLVNYANRPEVAADVRQVTAQPVGLVSYNQRPFLLAAHTTDPAAATTVLQALNDRGFNAMIIDSRSAILLTPAVVGTGG